MKPVEIEIGKKYDNGKGMVCEVLPEGPQAGLTDPEIVRYRIVSSAIHIPTARPGMEGRVSRTSFAAWAQKMFGEVKKKQAAPSIGKPKVQAGTAGVSHRTYYLSPNGRVSRAKPKAFVRTIRAANVQEAQERLAGTSGR